MNNRIKELARQAGLIAPHGSDREGLRDFDYRMFAELIIKEHLIILQQEWYTLNDLPNSESDTPRDIGIRVGQKSEIIRLLHLIQQHFGIESAPKLAHETNTDNPIDFPRE